MDTQILHTIRRHSKRPAQPLMVHGELMLLQLEDRHITSCTLPAVRRPAVMPARISTADEHFGERTWPEWIHPRHRGLVSGQQVVMRDASKQQGSTDVSMQVSSTLESSAEVRWGKIQMSKRRWLWFVKSKPKRAHPS